MPDAHTRIDGLKEDIQVIGDMVLDLRARAVAHDRRFDRIDTRLHGIDAQLAEILSRLPPRGNDGSAN